MTRSRRLRRKKLLFLDDDIDLPSNQFISDLNKFADKYPSAVISLCYFDKGSKFTAGYGNFISWNFVKQKKFLTRAEVININGKKLGFPCGQFLIRKSLWEKLSGYDTTYKFGGDDNDIGIRSWMYGHEVILYSERQVIHEGKRAEANVHQYSSKLRLLVSSQAHTILKNYSTKNVFWALPAYLLFVLGKGVKQSVRYRSLMPIIAVCKAVFDFSKNISKTIKLRKKIQRERIRKDDVYLNIR